MSKDAARDVLSSLGNENEDGLMKLNAIASFNGSPPEIDYKHMRNRLAPISSLPNEILSTIFQAGCVIPSCDRDFPPREDHFEILVSQISQHWRHVALATSRLWTNIVVKSPRLYHFEMANAYLCRSNVSALRLYIRLTTGDYTLEEVASLCQLVVPHIGRWHHIHITFDWREGFDLFIDHLPSFAPLLQELSIDRGPGEYDDFIESDVPRYIFVDGAPCLTSILAGGVTLQSCCPPLANVTHLRFNRFLVDVYSSRLRSTLAGLSALTHLVINTSFFVNWIEMGSIELPVLCSLFISGDADLIPGFLTAISAPSLQFLILEELVSQDITDMPLTIDFTSPSKFSSLHSLTILPCSDHIFPLSTWRLLYRIFPAVAHFTLSYSMDTFLGSLNEQTYPLEPSTPSPFWPQLRTLRLLDQSLHNNLIHAAVSARITLGHPIQKLQFSPSIMLSLEDDLEWLRRRVKVEECATDPVFLSGSSVVNWPERDGD